MTSKCDAFSDNYFGVVLVVVVSCSGLVGNELHSVDVNLLTGCKGCKNRLDPLPGWMLWTR